MGDTSRRQTSKSLRPGNETAVPNILKSSERISPVWIESWGIWRPSQHLNLVVLLLRPSLSICCSVPFSAERGPCPQGAWFQLTGVDGLQGSPAGHGPQHGSAFTGLSSSHGAPWCRRVFLWYRDGNSVRPP